MQTHRELNYCTSYINIVVIMVIVVLKHCEKIIFINKGLKINEISLNVRDYQKHHAKMHPGAYT